MGLAGVLGIIFLSLVAGGAAGYAACFAHWRMLARDVGLLGDDVAALTLRLKKREGAYGGEKRVELQRSREEAQLALMQQAALEGKARQRPHLVGGEPPPSVVANAFGSGPRQSIAVED